LTTFISAGAIGLLVQNRHMTKHSFEVTGHLLREAGIAVAD